MYKNQMWWCGDLKMAVRKIKFLFLKYMS